MNPQETAIRNLKRQRSAHRKVAKENRDGAWHRRDDYLTAKIEGKDTTWIFRGEGGTKL